MNIDCSAEKFIYHSGTFYMPAGSAHAPRTFPCGFAGFLRFPQCKIHRVFLVIGHVYARARLKVFKRLMRKLAVVVKFFCAEINISVHTISKTFVLKLFNDINYCVDIFGCSWVNGGALYAERLRVFEIFGDKTLAEFFDGNTLLIGAVNHFVINIGKILHKCNLISQIFKISAQSIEYNEGTCIADMEIIVHGRPARIHLYLAFCYGYKFFFFSGHGIVQFHVIFLPNQPQAVLFFLRVFLCVRSACIFAMKRGRG